MDFTKKSKPNGYKTGKEEQLFVIYLLSMVSTGNCSNIPAEDQMLNLSCVSFE